MCDVWEFVHNFLMFAANQRTRRQKTTHRTQWIYPGTQSPLLRKYRDTRRSRWMCMWPWILFAVFIEYHHHLLLYQRVLSVCSTHFAKSANSFELPFLLILCWNRVSSTYLKSCIFFSLSLKSQRKRPKSRYTHEEGIRYEKITSNHKKQQLHSRNPFFTTNKKIIFSWNTHHPAIYIEWALDVSIRSVCSVSLDVCEKFKVIFNNNNNNNNHIEDKKSHETYASQLQCEWKRTI